MKGDKKYIKRCKYSTEMADSSNKYTHMYCHHTLVNKAVLWKGENISEECSKCSLFEIGFSGKKERKPLA